MSWIHEVQYLEIMKGPCLKSEGNEPKASFVLRQKCKVSLAKQRGVSPSVLNGSVTQHLCLDKMYQIQVMKDPEESPHECVDFMNEPCSVFQRYIKHKWSVTSTLNCSCVFSPQKPKHSQWLGDPVKAFLLVIGLFIKPLFLIEEIGRKRITLDNFYLQRLGTYIFFFCFSSDLPLSLSPPN